MSRLQVITRDDIDFEKYEKDVAAEQKVRPAKSFLKEVLHEMMPADDPDKPKIARLPFANCWVDFAPSEMTLWAGYNSHGKSILQGQIAALFATQGFRCSVASFEMKPRKTMARMIRQMSGVYTPTRNMIEEKLGLLDNLWLYDQHGSIDARTMYTVCRHCAHELGVQHMFIDNLMKCVPGEDDYNAQKNFVDTIFQIGLDTGMHMHLVVHIRKGDEDVIPNRYAILGGAAVSNIPDNVLIVWRNKKKERDLEAGNEIKDGTPDAVLFCDKQRNGNWEGKTRLWFDKSCLRYSDREPKRTGLAAALNNSYGKAKG